MNPWEKKYEEWIDIYTWWQLVYNYVCLPNPSGKQKSAYEIQKIKKLFNIKKRICRDGISMKKICFYCRWLIKEQNRNISDTHAIIDEHNNLICPRIKEC